MTRGAAWAVALGLAGVVPARAQRPPEATGAVTGSVVLSSTMTARRPRIRLYADFGPGSRPQPAKPPPHDMANVVVYLDSTGWAPARADPSAPRLAIRQHHETFEPHVLPVLVGSRVDFPNDDPFFHNVFSLSEAQTFDLGRYPQGQSKTVLFDRPGIVQVFCHIHADMSAIVLALENAFYATPDSTGRYTLTGIPPGTYRLVGWHERARPVRETVRITAGETARVDFSIPVSAPPASR